MLFQYIFITEYGLTGGFVFVNIIFSKATGGLREGLRRVIKTLISFFLYINYIFLLFIITIYIRIELNKIIKCI